MQDKTYTRPRWPMPEDVRSALEESSLMEEYRARPPYQRNDYIGWISRGKRPETVQKRIDQMLQELQAGNVYMGMAWKAKKE